MNETWLAHHGIKGQKWGVRRFENKDGSLTEAGKKRYDKGNNKQKFWTDKKKNIAKGAAYVTATALIAYGGVKFASSTTVQNFIAKCLDKYGRKKNNIPNEDHSGQVFNTKTGKWLSEEESEAIIQRMLEKHYEKLQATRK